MAFDLRTGREAELELRPDIAALHHAKALSIRNRRVNVKFSELLENREVSYRPKGHPTRR
jgi:hypothetical protein